MSIADYNRAVDTGDIGQNFSARPGFFKSIQDKGQTLSLKNLYDQKIGAKRPTLGFLNFINTLNPALKVYDEEDEQESMFGISGKNLTDINRLAKAINKSQTVGITRDEYLDAFFGPNNPQDPRNRREGGDGDRGIPGIILPRPIAQVPSIMEQPKTKEEEELEGLRLAFRAEGGIIDEETGRQMYGLGKLVKKATRAVKKIAKSPIGKAALIGGGLGLAGIGPLKGLQTTSFGSSLSNFFGRGSFNPLKAIAGSIDTASGLDAVRSPFGQLISKIPGGGVGAAITAASILPLLGIGTGEESEEEAQAILQGQGLNIEEIRANPNAFLARRFRAEGGSMKEPVATKTMPLLDMGGQEMDLRAEGGFVPIGRMEKADDVPARLSKNEFVFTADAVRNAGDGNVDKGAEVMYNMMKNLEAGGEVSEESQGREGARRMFQTSKRLEEVL